MLLCSFLTLKCFSCYLPLIAMCGELSEVFAQLLGFCCFCSMRTLCKSSLEIATTLHPRRRTFYLLVESAKYEHSRCMAVQLPSVHPLRIDLPDSEAIVHLGNLLKICSFCEEPVQCDDSDRLDFGRRYVCPAIRLPGWPFCEWLELMPKSGHNLANAASFQTDGIMIWCCRFCWDFVPATAISSASSSSEPDSVSLVNSDDSESNVL